MGLFLNNALTLIFTIYSLATAIALPQLSPYIHEWDYSGDDIITRDVLIIGGGSSGTYSAIKLRDLGKSVAVVEKKAVLGGHTETYTDPVTKGKVDAGVIIWHDLDIVRNYFARFNIPLVKANGGASPLTDYVDFRNGKTVPGFIPPGNVTALLPLYAAQLAKYPYLEAGFDLPEPVPEDLLLSLVDFAKKYKLESLLFFLRNFAQGLGNILELPTIYIFKNFGLDVVRNLQIGFLTTARHNNHELYDKALAELGKDALVSSCVLAIDRNPSGDYAKVLVETPEGKKLILAKDIIITIPPLLKNLQTFDLDDKERDLFKKFKAKGYYTGVLRNSGLPDNVAIQNVGSDTPYNIPPFPSIYSLDPTGIPGLQNVKYSSDSPLPIEKVKADILQTMKRISTAGKLNNTSADAVELAFFSSHTPFELNVDAAAIKAGFYKELYALQGKGRFWYNGAAFHTHDSSLLWQFSEGLISRIVKK